MHLLSPNWLFACPSMPSALSLAWGWVPPYVCHTNVICVETYWRIWTPLPQLQVQTRKGLTPPDAEQHGHHWPWLISPPHWNRQAFTDLTENGLMGWPWFPGQMGVSCCGMPPVWTPFATPSNKHLPKTRVERRMQRLRKRRSALIWTKPITFSLLQCNLQCGWSRFRVFSMWPW